MTSSRAKGKIETSSISFAPGPADRNDKTVLFNARNLTFLFRMDSVNPENVKKLVDHLSKSGGIAELSEYVAKTAKIQVR